MGSETKRILKHSTIYAISNLLSKLIGFVMMPVYTAVLSKQENGVISLMELTKIALMIIVGMGLGGAFLRFYSEDKSEKAQETVISTSVIFITFFGLLVAGIGMIFSPSLSYLCLGASGYDHPFTVLMFVLLFTCMIEIPLVVLRAREKSMVYLMVCVTQFVMSCALNIVFIVFCKLSVGGWLLSSLWTSVAICTYLVISTLSHIKKIRFSFTLLKRMFSYSLPLIPASIAMFWIHNGDKYILANSDVGEVGVYDIGYKIAMMVPFLIGQPFWLAWSVRMYDVFEQDGGQKVYAKYFTYFCLVMLWFWVLLSVVCKDLIHIMATREEYHRAWLIVPIVAMGYGFRECSDFFRGVLYITRKTSFVGKSTFYAAVICTVLYLVLVPPFGQWGAAWATFFTFGSMALLMLWASRKVCKVPFEFGRLAVMTGLALAYVFGFLQFQIPNMYVDFLVKALFSLTYAPLLYLLGFFSEQEKVRIKGLIMRAAVLLRLKQTVS